MTENTTNSDETAGKETRPKSDRSIVDEKSTPAQNHAPERAAKQLNTNSQASGLKTMDMVQGLASVATVLALFFAGWQLYDDRSLRLIEARLTAVSSLTPEYVMTVLPVKLSGEYKEKDTISIPIEIDVLNQSGISMILELDGYVCPHFPIGSPLDDEEFRFNVIRKVEHARMIKEVLVNGRALRHPQETMQLGRGAHDVLVSVRLPYLDEGYKPLDGKVVLSGGFADISVSSRTADRIRDILSDYDPNYKLPDTSRSERIHIGWQRFDAIGASGPDLVTLAQCEAPLRDLYWNGLFEDLMKTPPG